VTKGLAKKGQSKELLALEAAQTSTEKARAIGNLLNKHLLNKNPTDEERDAIKQVFVDYPEMWTTVGDVMKQAIIATIEKAAPGVSVREAMVKGCNVIRTDLGYDSASMLEQLLIRQIVLCWLRLGIAESKYTQAVHSDNATFVQAMYWEKRLSMTQARYLKATEALAKVRKLSRAAPLQVNIGGQQVNLVAAEGSEQRVR
jgi:hypothetical protein